LIDPRELAPKSSSRMKRQTLLSKVEFRFRVRDLERFDFRGRRPALARLDLQPFQLVWRQ
jgi:hypothetical protein